MNGQAIRQGQGQVSDHRINLISLDTLKQQRGTWSPIEMGECICCGDEVEGPVVPPPVEDIEAGVSPDEPYFDDAANVCCMDCGLIGSISVSDWGDEERAYINWDEDWPIRVVKERFPNPHIQRWLDEDA